MTFERDRNWNNNLKLMKKKQKVDYHLNENNINNSKNKKKEKRTFNVFAILPSNLQVINLLLIDSFFGFFGFSIVNSFLC